MRLAAKIVAYVSSKSKAILASLADSGGALWFHWSANLVQTCRSQFAVMRTCCTTWCLDQAEPRLIRQPARPLVTLLHVAASSCVIPFTLLRFWLSR